MNYDTVCRSLTVRGWESWKQSCTVHFSVAELREGTSRAPFNRTRSAMLAFDAHGLQVCTIFFPSSFLCSFLSMMRSISYNSAHFDAHRAVRRIRISTADFSVYSVSLNNLMLTLFSRWVLCFAGSVFCSIMVSFILHCLTPTM